MQDMAKTSICPSISKGDNLKLYGKRVAFLLHRTQPYSCEIPLDSQFIMVMKSRTRQGFV